MGEEGREIGVSVLCHAHDISPAVPAQLGLQE